jgi:cytoskeletal protein RodZ
MGTLGRYLQEARQARGLDLREAAQQTRISVQFLKALEEEDFSKLPGEVFVKGFLKSYAKFLRLSESEVMVKYAELGQKPSPAAAPGPAAPTEAADGVQKRTEKIAVEPFIWGAAIVVILALFLFTALPDRQKEARQPAPAGLTGIASAPVSTATATTQKLYLEVVALENTWLLVRTDTSPQKKAVLNKGESLLWSADERFLLSYANAGAVKLLLNGQELTVNEPKNAPIRDMTITASGIFDRRIQAERPRPAKPKPQPAAPAKPVPQIKPSETLRGSQQAPAPTSQRQPQPQQLPQPLAPAPQNQPWGPSPNPAQ